MGFIKAHGQFSNVETKVFIEQLNLKLSASSALWDKTSTLSEPSERTFKLGLAPFASPRDETPCLMSLIPAQFQVSIFETKAFIELLNLKLCISRNQGVEPSLSEQRFEFELTPLPNPCSRSLRGMGSIQSKNSTVSKFKNRDGNLHLAAQCRSQAPGFEAVWDKR